MSSLTPTEQGLNVITEFPHEVQELEHAWIRMPDGTRLAARMWIPAGAEKQPVPAVLEYIPYRKRDLTRDRDSIMHPYFAGYGYACIRVDLRGTGDSEGVIRDQFLEQEQEDGVNVINWIADQPWCDGSVGMIGLSWGGFSALQLAARQPKPLKAIIAASATDDLYVDNMHYMGGCLLSDNLSEATTMFAFNSLPPDPELVGQRWRDMWLDRLDQSGLWLDTWLRHQHRDNYWRPGSVCEDYSAIRCPVFTISGWADGYSNAVFRLLSKLDVPRMGLIGPWSHRYPHLGIPGPAIGFLQEALRWWDQWLKGEQTGVMDEPMLRVWMQDSIPPTTSYVMRPGRWVGEQAWPSSQVKDRQYTLAPGHCLTDVDDVPVTEVDVQSPLTVGLFAGKWCSYSATPDLPHDQREEDGGSIIFETDELEEPIEILGGPKLTLELTADKPVAMVCARLSDVAPDGRATRVTYGLLNLTHTHGHADPATIEPGKPLRANVQLNGVAQHFPAGHRIRLSLSSSYWPLAWPPPEPARLSIATGKSVLTLPIRPPSDADEELSPFADPEGAQPIAQTTLTETEHNWRVIRELASDVSTLEVVKNKGTYRIKEIDLDVTSNTMEWYTSRADDFESLRGETYTLRGFRRGRWNIEVVTRTVLTCDGERFYLYATLDAYEGDKRIFSRNWDRTIPRNLV